MFFLVIIKSISFYSFSLGTIGGINNNKMTQTPKISIVAQSGFFFYFELLFCSSKVRKQLKIWQHYNNSYFNHWITLYLMMNKILTLENLKADKIVKCLAVLL